VTPTRHDYLAEKADERHHHTGGGVVINILGTARDDKLFAPWFCDPGTWTAWLVFLVQAPHGREGRQIPPQELHTARNLYAAYLGPSERGIITRKALMKTS
jgi:hypothetical protein